MPDYMFLLESRLSPEQRNALQVMAEIARAEALNIYLTGGAVRDLICGAAIRDLDITVEGNPARIVRELEKHGGRTLEENERLRHYEVLLPGGVEGSVSAAREEVYERPGAKPETRWSTIIEDLRRRDFSLNAIAISLNLASRGLLLDPTNGLADLEKREVRALSMHSFTNKPVRLLRSLRFAVRMTFKLEARTADWFALAKERKLHETLEGEEVGSELMQLGREENPIAILKEWAKHGLIGAIHPRLEKRAPDYESLARLLKVREAMAGAGYRTSLWAPVLYYVLGRLKGRERSSALHRLEFRTKAIERITGLESEAEKIIKMLKGRKTGAPRETYAYLETAPLEMLAFIQTEYSQPKALGKIKNFLYKWKPLRQTLPVAELEMLGVARGPQFDKIIEAFFQLQLEGRARNPQDRVPALRKLAGIKEPKKPKPPKEEPKAKGKAAKTGKAAEGAPAEAAKTAAAPAGKPGKAAAPVKQPEKVVQAPVKKPEKTAVKTKPAPKKKAAPKKNKRR
ncbi:MAG: CCA tRNA nucleotidyltransferase [Acidobacteria bacterium]|nr:CCA tRNA nucleotidyltransferase [Acidobacteriota bacterium]MBI3663211.1 CCA tRNA nucleotidyltransferase [Acidobacteriota bacterium]